MARVRSRTTRRPPRSAGRTGWISVLLATAAIALTPILPGGPVGAARFGGGAPARPMSTEIRAVPMLPPTSKLPVEAASLAPRVGPTDRFLPPVPYPVGPRLNSPILSRFPDVRVGNALAAPVLRSPQAAPGPATAPPNVVLTGNESMVVSTNTTVGNVSLSGDAILYVHNVSHAPTLTVDGNVHLADHALFFVNDSTLRIDLAYNVEYQLVALDTAGFALENATVTSNGYAWGMLFEQDTNLTVVDSMFCYPVGWVVTDLLQNASEWIVGSGYHSDVLLYDTDDVPSTARFTAVDTAGFNLWLNLRGGSSANLTLPGINSWQNFTFPGATDTTGVAYHVALRTCYVQVFAVMPWQGSNLTLTNSSDVAIALNLDGTVALAGLTEGHQADFDLTTADESIHLRNTTVFTWNVYPFVGTVTVNDSQIGEVQVYNAANGTLNDCDLTGHGGYYGNQGTGELEIANSTFHTELVSTDGATTLDNDTFAPPADVSVLAAGTGLIRANDVTLGPRATYQTLAEGRILVSGKLTVSVQGPIGPVEGALVRALATAISGFIQGYSDASGNATFLAPGEEITAAGTTPTNENLTGQAGYLWGSGVVPGPTEPTVVTLTLTSLVLSTQPANGTSNVSVTPGRVEIQFAEPMNIFATESVVSSMPAEPFFPGWGEDNTSLDLAIPQLPSHTTLEILVGAGARTLTGIDFLSPFSFEFRTGGPNVAPTPEIVSTDPAEGGTSVARNATIEVTFNVPMNASSLASAFSLSPAPMAGVLTLGTATLSWGPPPSAVGGAEPLFAPDQLYVLTISGSARSAAGVALGSSYRLAFETAGPPPSSSKGTGSASPSAPSALDWGLVAAVALFAVIAVLGWVRPRRPRAPPRPLDGAADLGPPRT